MELLYLSLALIRLDRMATGDVIRALDQALGFYPVSTTPRLSHRKRIRRLRPSLIKLGTLL